MKIGRVKDATRQHLLDIFLLQYLGQRSVGTVANILVLLTTVVRARSGGSQFQDMEILRGGRPPDDTTEGYRLLTLAQRYSSERSEEKRHRAMHSRSDCGFHQPITAWPTQSFGRAIIIPPSSPPSFQGRFAERNPQTQTLRILLIAAVAYAGT